MKNSTRPYREQGTLVITTGDEVFPAITEIEWSDFSLIPSLLHRDRKGDFQSRTLRFEKPESSIAVNFNYRFNVEIIHVNHDESVINIYTEPGHSSKSRYVKLFGGLYMIILAPKGFVKEHGIKVGKTTISLRSPMAYGPVYFQHVWRKEILTKSDQEIIDIYNSITGKGYRGISGSSQMCELGREIHSRNFDSSIIVTLNKDGSTYSYNYSKKVRLAKNKLEFLDE